MSVSISNFREEHLDQSYFGVVIVMAIFLLTFPIFGPPELFNLFYMILLLVLLIAYPILIIVKSRNMPEVSDKVYYIFLPHLLFLIIGIAPLSKLNSESVLGQIMAILILLVLFGTLPVYIELKYKLTPMFHSFMAIMIITTLVRIVLIFAQQLVMEETSPGAYIITDQDLFNQMTILSNLMLGIYLVVCIISLALLLLRNNKPPSTQFTENLLSANTTK